MIDVHKVCLSSVCCSLVLVGVSTVPNEETPPRPS